MTNTSRLLQNFNEERLIYALDKYGDYGVLHSYESEIPDVEKLGQKFLKQYDLKGIYLKRRFTDEDDKATELISGKAAPAEFEVVENNLKFLIKIKDHKDIGLFLDHRISREIIRDYSKGKKVLNLFGYTGSFSVYSQSAGAISTTTVDLSKTYCAWAEANFKLNNMDLAQNEVWCEDVFDYIQSSIKLREKFDIVVCDPPTFSRSPKRTWSVQSDHVELIRDLQKLVNPGGFLFFSTNYSEFRLHESLRRSADKLTKKTIPPEFKPLTPHQSFVFYM